MNLEGEKLKQSFYERKDVVKIARDLLGKTLVTCIDGKITGGRIVETEAYSWRERGCHAFDARKTKRNAVMFGQGGYAYVYLCYGIHHLFNIVTNREGVAEAVLVRALEPSLGIGLMENRRRTLRPYQLTSGPGKLTRALGIDGNWNGKCLLEGDIWVEDWGERIAARQVIASPRIGIDYAGKDAKLPWRFHLKDNQWVSG